MLVECEGCAFYFAKQEACICFYCYEGPFCEKCFLTHTKYYCHCCREMSLIEKAKQFATEAHASINHRRKYTNEPYIVHPENVARIVTMVTDDEHMISAAYLHDVLEDVYPKNNYYDSQRIEDEFGTRVAELVIALTDVSRPEDGNREIRKRMDRERIAKIDSDAKTIKLADLIDNTQTILKYDKNFARIYLREMKLLLEVLGEGNPILYKKALEICK